MVQQQVKKERKKKQGIKYLKLQKINDEKLTIVYFFRISYGICQLCTKIQQNNKILSFYL